MSEAERLNERGRELDDQGDEQGAIDAYRAAIAAAPAWSVPWYNLGLVHKYAGRWAESAECNREALTRNDADEAAWWNLGIAATALGDWAGAREAWARCGIEIADGEGPIEMHFGLVPIRLDPEGRGEVVWSDRVDPARAIIRNVPLPESGHFYGDVMLHDGAQAGSRMRNGREVPVFNALARLERSPWRTFILDLPGSTEEQRNALADVAYERGSWAEDWSESLRFLCRNCSYGLPHREHDEDLKDERPDLAVAAAARDEDDVAEMLAAWRERVGYTGYAGFTEPEGDS